MSRGESVRRGESFLNLDCNITVGSKVFYESSLYYDRGIVKMNLNTTREPDHHETE